MTRYVYVNGRYAPYNEAVIHAEDRGNQFGDAVYEVCEVKGGKLIDETQHMKRLERSLGELKMSAPMSLKAMGRIMRECVRRNRVVDGLVYLQVSRGAGRRDFLFPKSDVPPTLIVIARGVNPAKAAAQAEEGIAIKTMPDNRWGRVDIKTVMLLPSVIAKEAARVEGAKEAWLIDAKGFVTEGGSSNAWIVTENGELVTRPADNSILKGITREVVMTLAARQKLVVRERPFTVAEALKAREAFVTSATNTVMPVVRIDGKPVGNGAPGLIATELRRAFHTAAETAA
jgi:D-alanine transaminase